MNIELSNGNRYSEAHHIKPLGSPHNGPDTAENIVVLCPNHHVMLDYGVIPLEKDALNVVAGHSVSEEYIVYHNTVIMKGFENI